MATSFKPVGVRAVVLDADKFIADLGRMQAAVGAFVTSARSVGAAQARAAAGAAQAASGFTANATAAQAAAQGQIQYATTVATAGASQVRLAASTLSTVDALTILAARIAQTRQQQQLANNVALQTIAGNQRLSNSLLKLVQQRAQLQQAISRNQQAQSNAANKIKQETALRERLGKSIQKEGNAQKKLATQISATQTKVNVAQQNLGTMRVEMSKLDSKTGEFSAKMVKLGGSIQKATGDIRTGNLKLDELRTKLAQAEERAESFQNEMSQSGARTEQFGQELNELGADAKRLGGSLVIVEDRMRRLASIAGKLGAAMAVARAGMVAAAGAARTLGRAMLVPHNLVGAFGTGILRLGKAGESISRGLFRMGNSVRFLGQSMTFFVSLPIAAVLGGMTKAAIDFETSFTNVVKTVDDLVVPGTLNTLNEQGTNLREGLRRMALEIPFSASELAELTAVAGQLGVRGNASLLGFTRVAADLAASTDVDLEQAATAIARLVTVTGTLDDAGLAAVGFIKNQKDLAEATEAAGGELSDIAEKGIRAYNQGTGQAVTESERFVATVQSVGGVLVNLGNNLPAYESEILTFTRDIAGVAAAFRFAQEDIFGLATAFAAVGVPAARGSTAVQTVMVEMFNAISEGGDKLEIWAKLAGTSVDKFVASFREGGRAVTDLLVDSFSSLTELGPDAVAVLDALDVGNRRNLKSILPTVTANNLMAESVDVAREGYQAYGEELGEFNALQIEALRRYATTESQLKILGNQFKDLGITIGEVILPVISDFVMLLRGLILRISQVNPEILKLSVYFLLAVAAIGPIVTAAGLLAASLGLVLLTIFKVVTAFGLIISVLGGFAIPIFAVIAAIVGLAIAFVASFNKIQEATGAAEQSLTQRMFAFGKNIIISFARGMAAAIGAVLTVLIWIGNTIAGWLSASSPPKLLPELENWGKSAMESYMEGWTKADFSTFKSLAGKIESFIRSLGDKIDEKNVIPSIIGSRGAIQRAIQHVREMGEVTRKAVEIALKGIPRATLAVRKYIRAMLEAQQAAELVKRAQESLNAVTKRYEEALRPLNDRLGEISDRRQEVRDMMRLEELQKILSDPRASDLVRELANLEIEEIGIEKEIDTLEEARDKALELAEAELAAAEAALQKAEDNLSNAESLLDIQIRNNELVQEQIDLLESLKEKMKKVKKETEKTGKELENIDDILSGLGGGGLDDLGEEGIPGLPDLDEMFTDVPIDPFIDTLIGDIEGAIAEIVAELETAFAPIGDLWEELGDVWAPVFIKMGEWWVSDGKPALDELIEWIGTAKTDTRAWINEELTDLQTKIGEIKTAISELATTTPVLGDESLLNIGQTGASSEGPKFSFLDKLQTAFANFTSLPIIKQISDTITSLVDVLGVFGDVFRETIGPALVGVGPAFSGLGDSLARLGETVRESGILPFLVGIAEIIAKVIGAGIVLQFVAILGSLAAIITALSRNLQLSIPFVIGFLEGLGKAFFGVIRFVKGFINFFVSLFKLMRDPNNVDAMISLEQAVRDMAEGLLEVVAGIFQSIVSLLAGLVAGAIGLIGGFLEGAIGFIVGLLELLPGEIAAKLAEFLGGIKEGLSAGLDGLAEWSQEALEIMGGWVDSIIEFFEGLWDDLVGNSIVPDMLQDITEAFTEWISGNLEAVGQWVSDSIEWWTEVKDTVIELVGILVGGVVAAVGGLLLTLLGNWAQIWLDANTKWFEIKELIKTKVDETILDVSIKILDLIAKFLGWWATLWLDANTKWNEIKTLIGDALAAILQAALDWAQPYLDSLMQPINDFIAWIKKELIGKAGEFYKMGAAIVQSLIDGIKSKIEALKRAAQELINIAKGGAEDEGESGSPWKLFVRMGEEITNSLIKGMSDTANNIATAGGRAASAASAGIAANASASGGVVAAPLASPPGSSNVNIDFGGQNITNGMDAAEFKVLVERTVRDLI